MGIRTSVDKKLLSGISSMGMVPLKRCFGVLFVLGLILIGGCVYKGEEVRYADRLNLDWSTERTWTVRTTRWPARIESPSRRGDTTVRQLWQYDVSHPMGEESDSGHLRVTSNDDRYRMELSSTLSVRSVKAMLSSSVPGIQKTRWIGRDRGWGGSGPLYPSMSRSKLNNLWFFPSLSGTELNRWNRFTILSSQRSTGHWVEQKVVPTRGGLKFILRNRSRTERIEFQWYRGDPWPASVVWTLHDRVVGTARLVSVSESG